jgi:hypothetical protein
MRSKSLYLLIIVSVGFLLSGIASVGTVAWCRVIGGCEFGKYEAKVIINDAKTQEPLENREIATRIDYGSLLFINVEEWQIVETDDRGEANIEFDRAFYSPLAIAVVSKSPETRASFGFDFRNIRENATLTQTETEYSPETGETDEKIKLVLEVGNWSLGKARKGMIEE